MNRETPTLREVAEQMIADGAVLLRVNEGLLENGYLLVTAHGDGTSLGPATARYTEYRSIRAVQVGNEQYQFDYEFDPSGPTTLGCVHLYVAEELAEPESGVLEATSLERGLNGLRDANAGGSE